MNFSRKVHVEERSFFGIIYEEKFIRAKESIYG